MSVFVVFFVIIGVCVCSEKCPGNKGGNKRIEEVENPPIVDTGGNACTYDILWDYAGAIPRSSDPNFMLEYTITLHCSMNHFILKTLTVLSRIYPLGRRCNAYILTHEQLEYYVKDKETENGRIPDGVPEHHKRVTVKKGSEYSYNYNDNKEVNYVFENYKAINKTVLLVKNEAIKEAKLKVKVKIKEVSLTPWIFRIWRYIVLILLFLCCAFFIIICFLGICYLLTHSDFGEDPYVIQRRKRRIGKLLGDAYLSDYDSSDDENDRKRKKKKKKRRRKKKKKKKKKKKRGSSQKRKGRKHDSSSEDSEGEEKGRKSKKRSKRRKRKSSTKKKKELTTSEESGEEEQERRKSKKKKKKRSKKRSKKKKKKKKKKKRRDDG